MSSKHLAYILIYILITTTPLNADVGETDVPSLPKPVCVSGVVLAPNGARVPGATIRILESGQQVVSDARGVFIFKKVFRAQITLEAHDSYYETVTLGPLDLTKPLKADVRLIFHRLRTFESTVVITATRDNRLLKDVPVRTEVITSKQIEERGAITLADVLDATTGLRVENNCQNCGFNSLRINGLAGGYTHILVNDMGAFSSLASVYGLEHIPTVIIDRIEVVKGGASSIYGAGAVGGVVNVITKSPTRNAAYLESGYASFNGGAVGKIRGYGSWVGGGGHSAFFAYGNLSNSGAYDRNGDGFTDIPNKTMENAGVKFFQRLLNDQAELQLGVDLTHENRRGGDDLNLPPQETALTEWIESTRTTYNAQWNHNLSGKTYYRIQFTHAESKRNTYYGGGFDHNAYGYTTNPHTNIALTLGSTAGTHNLLGGIQYERDSIDDRHPGYGYRLDQAYGCYGLFVQDDFKINRAVSLLAGARIDKHAALKNPILSPRVSALFTASKNFRVRTNLSFGFKAPVTFDEDLHILMSGGEPTFHINAPDLKEERALSFSFSGEFDDNFSNGIYTRLEANFFYTKLSNTFINDEIERAGKNATYFMRINGGSSKVYGLEINAYIKLPVGFDVETGFTFQRTCLDEPEPDFGSTRFFRTPDEYGFLALGYSHDRFSLFGRLEYTGSMLAPHYAGWIENDVLEETPAFTLVSVRFVVPVIKKPFGLNLVGDVYNLTDVYQEDLDKGPNRDSGYIYGPRRSRTLSIGLKFEF